MDHLKRFEAGEETKFTHADVDLDALPVRFGLESGTINAGARPLGVPGDQVVTFLEGGAGLRTSGAHH